MEDYMLLLLFFLKINELKSKPLVEHLDKVKKVQHNYCFANKILINK